MAGDGTAAAREVPYCTTAQLSYDAAVLHPLTRGDDGVGRVNLKALVVGSCVFAAADTSSLPLALALLCSVLGQPSAPLAPSVTLHLPAVPKGQAARLNVFPSPVNVEPLLVERKTGAFAEERLWHASHPSRRSQHPSQL